MSVGLGYVGPEANRPWNKFRYETVQASLGDEMSLHQFESILAFSSLAYTISATIIVHPCDQPFQRSVESFHPGAAPQF